MPKTFSLSEEFRYSCLNQEQDCVGQVWPDYEGGYGRKIVGQYSWENIASPRGAFRLYITIQDAIFDPDGLGCRLSEAQQAAVSRYVVNIVVAAGVLMPSKDIRLKGENVFKDKDFEQLSAVERKACLAEAVTANMPQINKVVAFAQDLKEKYEQKELAERRERHNRLRY